MSRKHLPRKAAYENRNVIYRQAKDGNFAFFYFSVIFGAAVYLIATALIKGIHTELVPTSVLSFLF